MSAKTSPRRAASHRRYALTRAVLSTPTATPVDPKTLDLLVSGGTR